MIFQLGLTCQTETDIGIHLDKHTLSEDQISTQKKSIIQLLMYAYIS